MTLETFQLPANYRVSVKALIRDPKDSQKIMLIREEDGQWELPGGGLDHDELPTDGLARELMEEIGAKAKSINPRPVGFWTLSRQVGSKLGYFGMVVYEVELFPGEYTQSEEAMEIGFFSSEEIQELELHANIESLVEKI